ncbi:MAG: hypothetical protein DMG65_07270 [Candidatus Angelobacter sp. Gp1-AA117]|nr:MAG: hypothetical protein DMG65_07270 [Candidatus Angelobacter sp. Gp1-AA117]
MNADSKFHHRSTQINTDYCWVTMLEVPSHDEKNFRNSNTEGAKPAEKDHKLICFYLFNQW